MVSPEYIAAETATDNKAGLNSFVLMCVTFVCDLVYGYFFVNHVASLLILVNKSEGFKLFLNCLSNDFYYDW